MQLAWTRPNNELKEVLLYPESSGPETAYWIFSGVTDQKWENMTLLTPGKYGKEYTKTFGHYHPPDTLETSRHISGDGIYILQKKLFENGKWIEDMVEAVYMVKFEPGDELTISSEFGHAWANVGTTPLVVYDDWRIKHKTTDYDCIKNLHGMCFYIVDDNGIKFVPNKNYRNHPEPKIVSPQEFQKLNPIK